MDLSSPDFLHGTREESLSITFFQILDFWSHSGNIRDQSRKLSKIALNFGRFVALPNFRGPAFQKLYQYNDPCLVARRMFCRDTPTSPEVIMANTLNFKPNFKFSRLKFWGEPPSYFGCALSRFGQSLARVKISGRSTSYGLRYSLPKKCILVGPNSHGIPSRSPDLFHRTSGVTRVFCARGQTNEVRPPLARPGHRRRQCYGY